MPLTYPQPVNYPSGQVPIPSSFHQEPQEGRLSIPLEILWDTMGGAGKSVGFDFQEDGTHPIRQIASVVVDNSACAAVVQLLFPDTGEVLTIPASAKRVAVPVYTNALAFVLVGTAPPGGAVTRIQVLNYRIPPVVIL